MYITVDLSGCCGLCLAERTGTISFLRLMKMKNWTFALEMK